MKIEDYALIGDCQTAALVGRNGSIDWLCWPRCDSGACFAALLGGNEHGHWRIAPAGGTTRTRRSYRRDTLILETEFETGEGAAKLIDFMPLRNGQSNLVRIVAGIRGRVTMEMELILRFDYGDSVPWVTRMPDGKGIRAIAGPCLTVLCSPVELHGCDLTTAARFDISAGETLSFVLSYAPSHVGTPGKINAAAALAETERFWRDWAGRGRRVGGAGAPVSHYAPRRCAPATPQPVRGSSTSMAK